MRAWCIEQFGEPRDALVQAEVPLPEPGPGQLRIRVEAAALGLPDVFMCRQRYVFDPPPPRIPGQEVVGRVTAAGEGAATPVGARVMAVTAFFLGHGGLAEEALALDASSYPAPDEMDAAQAACFVIPYHTAWLGLVTRGRVQAGDTLLVLGAAGGTGSAAIQLGHALGARVLAVAGGAEKARACRRLGADAVFDHRAEDWVTRVQEVTQGQGVDLVYDPVGGEAFDQALGCLASEGRLLVIGYASGKWSDASSQLLVQKNASVVGVFVGAYQKPFLETVHAELLAHWRAERLPSLVSRQVPFDAVPEALTALAQRRTTGKVVVRLSGFKVADGPVEAGSSQRRPSMSLFTTDPRISGVGASKASMVQQSQRLGRVVRIDPGHVRVTSSTWLYGLLFSAAGAGLGVGAVEALLHHQKPILVAVLAVMSLLFLAVGVLPAWDRIRLEIRPGGIDYERRARGVRQQGHLPRDVLQRLHCKRVVYQSSKGGSSTRYPVSLVFDPARLPEGFPDELSVRAFARETQARSEAESLARDLDLPLEDAIGGEPVLRAPDALDTRVAREDDPGMPPPGLGVGITPALAGTPGLAVRSGTPAGRRLLVAVAVLSLSTTSAGLVFLVGFGSSAGGPHLPFPALILLVGGELAFLLVFLSTAWLQRFRLSVETGHLTLERYVGPLRVSRASLPAEQIESLRIGAAGPFGSGLAIVSDARILRIPQLRPEAAAWLRRWLASRVGA